MVADSREALRAGTGKPVNVPALVNVEEDAAGMPSALIAKRKQAVTSIIDRWRIDDEWWRSEPVSRFYYNVILSSGQRVTVYKDILNRKWFRQSYDL